MSHHTKNKLVQPVIMMKISSMKHSPAQTSADLQ